MTTDELLPCPFCGCETIKTVVQDDHLQWRYYI